MEIAIYIVDLEDMDPNSVYEDVRNFFPAGHKPASMVIGVSALAYPGLLVEINVRAVYGLARWKEQEAASGFASKPAIYGCFFGFLR